MAYQMDKIWALAASPNDYECLVDNPAGPQAPKIPVTPETILYPDAYAGFCIASYYIDTAWWPGDYSRLEELTDLTKGPPEGQVVGYPPREVLASMAAHS